MNDLDWHRRAGFTIVELLIVIIVIAILASISIVVYSGVRTRAQASQVVNDLRNIGQTLQRYEVDNGRLPCFDHSWSDGQEVSWSAPYMRWPKNPTGSQYHWEHNIAGATVSISMPNLGADLAVAVDRAFDDGNLSTGNIYGDGSRLEYRGMNQNVTTVHPGDDC